MNRISQANSQYLNKTQYIPNPLNPSTTQQDIHITQLQLPKLCIISKVTGTDRYSEIHMFCMAP